MNEGSPDRPLDLENLIREAATNFLADPRTQAYDSYWDNADDGGAGGIYGHLEDLFNERVRTPEDLALLLGQFALRRDRMPKEWTGRIDEYASVREFVQMLISAVMTEELGSFSPEAEAGFDEYMADPEDDDEDA